ncbi:UDP-glucuronosyltransferase 2C1-like [Denticeps clupeoides]|uniref:UDP-glucuronosyltransferase 2C1-like n=1 Tax=Denticeps clupeoides TaxID=299321 RepID=UPI0010A2B412|nr:UDP-glucuronosyltransferase 2C1-like [Denticeps clupeoides]
MTSVRPFCFILQGLLLVGFYQVESGNVLVIPGEFSHWHNMRVIVEELVERNHSVTVLVSTASNTVKYAKEEGFRFQFFSVSHEEHEFSAMWDEMTDIWVQYQNSTILHTVSRVIDLMKNVSAFEICEAMIKNETVMGTLRQSKFDVVLYDPFIVCGDLLADMLNVPLIIVMKMFFGYTLERICGQMPSTPSYIPTHPVRFSDRMNFPERVQNFLQYVMLTTIFYTLSHVQLNPMYSEIKGEPVTLCDSIGKAEIWLMRSYWNWDYPRPFPPNFVFIGGYHCKPPKPLPKDMEDFVQSSGDDGIVIFSLGSIFKNQNLEMSNKFASALGKIPQKVLWALRGEKPETLAPNTRIYDWIPQKDLLGHPKTKAFISHGGSNGMFEAIYHGVPIVGIPLFGDQFENILFIKNKGAAVMLDFFKLEAEDLVEALDTVINDPSYKKNMMRMSELHHDQPTKPLDRALFWIEFVMRNKGAKHLRVQAHNLSWFQYYCLDVAVFLLTVVGLFIFFMVKTCCFCIRKCSRRTRSKNKTE